LQLERRTRSGGGRDQIDHPAGSGLHDDAANAGALSCVLTAQSKFHGAALGTLPYDVRPGYGENDAIDSGLRAMLRGFKK